jgi:hypothetical protein
VLIPLVCILVTDKTLTPSRLPRRYLNDKNRDTSAPIIGTSGSTPLHFAAANRHTQIVSILLNHGAIPDHADKHGIMPEMLAHQNGRAMGSNTEGGVGSKQLCVKRSIESTLHLLKHSINNLSEANLSRPHAMSPSMSLGLTEPLSPTNTPFGEYTFYPMAPHSSEDVSSRRPSLPHIFEDVPKKPVPSPHYTSRRPRSARTGAAPQPTPTRKLSTKYSLLHLFRKLGDSSSSLTPERPTPECSFSASPTPGSANNTPSASPMQIPQPLPESLYVSMNQS